MATKGHNSLTDKEKKALFFHHLRKRMSHNAKLAEINTDKKSDGKLAQADGLVLGDLDYAIKTINAEDKEIVANGYMAHGEILSWLNVIHGFQPDLFVNRAPVLDRIKNEGELAGLAGKDGVSPYDKGSTDDKTWLEGWREGQNVLAGPFLQSAREKLELTDDEAPEGDDPFGDE